MRVRSPLLESNRSDSQLSRNTEGCGAESCCHFLPYQNNGKNISFYGWAVFHMLTAVTLFSLPAALCPPCIFTPSVATYNIVRMSAVIEFRSAPE